VFVTINTLCANIITDILTLIMAILHAYNMVCWACRESKKDAENFYF